MDFGKRRETTGSKEIHRAENNPPKFEVRLLDKNGALTINNFLKSQQMFFNSKLEKNSSKKLPKNPNNLKDESSLAKPEFTYVGIRKGIIKKMLKRP
jgi:hypothetical protein